MLVPTFWGRQGKIKKEVSYAKETEPITSKRKESAIELRDKNS